MHTLELSFFRRVLLTFLVLLPGTHALAVGLGNARVSSYLNQPLRAQIQIITRSGEELGTVTANLASAEDFEMMGLKRHVSVPLHFEMDTETETGNAFVTVSSRLPITDPVIQLVLEVRWSGGRMLREYTLFLDPPTFASKAPLPMVSTRPAVAESTPEPEPESAPPTENYPDPANQDVVETIKPVLRSEAPEQREELDESPLLESQETIADPTIVSPDDVSDQGTRETVTVPGDPTISESPEPEQKPQPEPDIDDTEASLQQDFSVDAEPSEITELAVDPAPEPELAAEPGLSEIEEVTVSTTDDSVEELLPAVEEPEDPLVSDITDKKGIDSSELAEADTPEEKVTDDQVTQEEAIPEPEPQAQAVIEPNTRFETDGEIHGPVERGDTLWGIARDYTRGSNYSINQAMLAIQRLNPDAFGRNNINSLKQGAILRMPTFSEAAKLTKRQAMIEALRQEQNYAAMKAGVPYEDLPAIAEQSNQQLTDNSSSRQETPQLAQVSDQGRLQLIPPLHTEQQSSGGGSGTGAVSSADVGEVLARTEEELANAQQENEYLAERIRELEAQITEQQGAGEVTDSELAGMEENLRENRLAGDQGQDSSVAEDSASQKNQDEPWYLAYAWWIGGLVVLFIAAVVWILRRMGGGHTAGPKGEPSSEKPAEEPGEPIESEPNVIEMESFADSGSGTVDGEQSTGKAKTAKIIPLENEEAEELDSNDPEVKLDLARAYLSMGDSKAARSMLEEVVESGNEAQINEAQEMMEEL